jgi:protocatechuate 3,4-dioxygenase alpha subunit
MSEAPAGARLGLTPSQTVGPYLHIGLTWQDGPYVVPEGAPESFWVTGVVYDGHGDPVTDAMVETWQADPDGRFDHPDDPRGAVAPSVAGFRGFGRCSTDGDGRYRILTVKPGPLPAPEGGAEAPHVDVAVFARGLLDRVVTRLYFPDEEAANVADPVLSEVPEARRGTLVARREGNDLIFDVRIQGDGETVFFEV